MNEKDFEGSLILEKLAETNSVEEFFDAVDSDDFKTAKKLMLKAGIDEDTIRLTLNKMADADGEH